MKKPDTDPSVNVASLKAKLAKYLRIVRSGRALIVTDRRQPIARIVPFEPLGSLETVAPEQPFSEVSNIQGVSAGPGVDSVQYLLEERGKR